MLRSYALTDIGRKRQLNQDYIYLTENPVGNLPNLFIVADGMGGHKAGDYASDLAVETVVKEAGASLEKSPSRILGHAITIANRILRQRASENFALSGMGTTLVAATCIGRFLEVANVGDSRLYVIGDEIVQITEDHSLVEEMVRMGGIGREEARNHPDKNIITRAIGARDDVEVDFFNLELQTGDMVLLCSDGLTNMVDDETICRILKNGKSLRDRVEELVRTANENGGRDNISVIVIETLADEESYEKSY
ncbi:MAG: Stp1/IreP family PP2C-type Ser/Thr phosphatase [Lachnospiraceae bacterium]|nr:Stp1/IreP family PP2C-type Ser/Thr phosphatase [Lachnospiraceae bacterium]